MSMFLSVLCSAYAWRVYIGGGLRSITPAAVQMHFAGCSTMCQRLMPVAQVGSIMCCQHDPSKEELHVVLLMLQAVFEASRCLSSALALALLELLQRAWVLESSSQIWPKQCRCSSSTWV